MRKIKIVGGILYPNEKGEITIPPKQSLEISLHDKSNFVTIPVQETRNKETER